MVPRGVLAKRGVGQGHKGVLIKLPTCLTSQAHSQTEFAAVGKRRALRQGPNRKITTFKNSNAFARFAQGPKLFRRNTFGASNGQSAGHDIESKRV